MPEEHVQRPGSGDGPVVAVRTHDGGRLELTVSEYRLALLGLVDFNGDWDALETACGLVNDAGAKARLVRDRLRPNAERLPALLTRGVDALDLLSARFWFRQEHTGKAQAGAAETG